MECFSCRLLLLSKSVLLSTQNQSLSLYTAIYILGYVNSFLSSLFQFGLLHFVIQKVAKINLEIFELKQLL